VSKGAVGAGALAVLFIVAQVAQNFFSAQYGLYMGGIIAGTFLFVASPVQKAIERRAGNAPAKAGTRPGKEEAYRSALRFALRDRALSPQERIALAHLADELGLTAGRAAELESEVVDDGITPKSSARRPAGRPRS
jgi:hypothetical protein